MKLTHIFLYLTFLTLPAFMIRGQIFQLPTNLLEIIIGITFLTFIWENHSQLSKFIKKILKPHPPFLTGVLLILTGATIGMINAIDIDTALGIWKGWIIDPLLVWIMLYYETQNSERPSRLINLSFLMAGISTALLALWGIWEFTLGIEETADQRLASIFSNANQFALLAAPLLTFHTLSLFTNRHQKSWRVVIVILLSIALILTRSYGGILATFGALIISIFFSQTPRKLKVSFGIALVLIISSLLTFESQTNKFSQTLDLQNRSSSSVRLELWQVAANLGQQHPLLGIGLGQFEPNHIQQAYDILGHLPLEWNHPQPHNLLLAFWLQTGLFGLLGFMLLIIVSIQNLWSYRQNPLASPLFGALLVILLHGVIDTPFWRNDLALVFWLMIAGVMILKTNISKTSFQG